MEIKENKENLKIILDDSSNLSLNQIRRLLNDMSSLTRGWYQVGDSVIPNE